MRKLLLILSVILLNTVHAQEVKFGKISKDEFSKTDTTSVAIVLYKNQKTFYDYRVDDGFVQVTEYFKRIKINTKQGLKYANIIQVIYDETALKKEIIEGIKGLTYNFVDGKIEKTKLKSKEVYDEKFNKYWKKIKIVMPNTKIGSVIDIAYYVESPFSHKIKDVVLQEPIPIKQFECQIKIPEYYSFKIHENIKSNYKIQLTEDGSLVSKHIKFRHKEVGELEYKTIERKLDYKDRVIKFNEKNIPPLEKEAYSPELNNYAMKLVFDLQSTKSFSGILENYASSWDIITKEIQQSYSFGEELKKERYFKNDLDVLLTNLSSQSDKVSTIFNFVKSKVKWNGFNGFNVHEGVKQAYKKGVGNVADINLMLTSMLRYAGIESNPILVSTRSNGIPLYPTRQGFNYVLCGVEVENDVMLLDATDKYSTIDVIPERTLNWKGRIIRKSGSSAWVNLLSKSKSKSVTMVSATLDKDLVFKGKLRNQITDYVAKGYRGNYAGVVKEDLIKSLADGKGEIEISNLDIKNINNLSKPILQTYDFRQDSAVEQIGKELYISPLLFLTGTENIFNEKKS